MSDKAENVTIKIPGDENEMSWIPIVVLCLIQLWPIAGLLFFIKFNSRRKNKQKRRFRRCAVVIGKRPYMKLSDLQRALGRDEDFLRADLQKMIDNGYMGRDAYIDMSTECIVVDPHRREENMHSTQTVKQKPKAPVQTETPKPAPQPEQPKPAPQPKPKVSQADEHERILTEIRGLNDRIDDEPVSRKIDRIGEITASIFGFVKQKPDRRDEVNKFMSYYLPTTMKLLESYSLLEKQSYQGENIVSARRDIEKILDSMVPAFEKQLDRLFRTDAIDISADIEVLETMMAKDGLSDSPGFNLRTGK